MTVVANATAPAGGWEKYRLTICQTSPTGVCGMQDCSPVLAPPASTLCTLTSLSQATTYSVQVAAVKGGQSSLNSTAQSFATFSQE